LKIIVISVALSSLYVVNISIFMRRNAPQLQKISRGSDTLTPSTGRDIGYELTWLPSMGVVCVILMMYSRCLDTGDIFYLHEVSSTGNEMKVQWF